VADEDEAVLVLVVVVLWVLMLEPEPVEDGVVTVLTSVEVTDVGVVAGTVPLVVDIVPLSVPVVLDKGVDPVLEPEAEAPAEPVIPLRVKVADQVW